MTQEIKDFLRKYKDLTETMDKIIGSLAKRVELTQDEREMISKAAADLKSLTYYARKHDNQLK